MTDDSFKLRLLLASLRITCRYYRGDEYQCGVSEEYWHEVEGDSHIACNCDGDINKCDLPDKFQACL